MELTERQQHVIHQATRLMESGNYATLEEAILTILKQNPHLHERLLCELLAEVLAEKEKAKGVAA